jgi:hypothetical protein
MQLVDLNRVRQEITKAGGLSVADALRLVEEVEFGRTVMRTSVEVYALAADQETGLWLLDPDGAWPGDTVMDYSEPHTAAEFVMIQRGAMATTRLLHQTSCRTEINEATNRSHQVDTFLAAIQCPGLVKDEWPQAEPVTPELLHELGRPATHGPTDPPVVTDGDVLKHGLRHLRFQLDPDGDATTAQVLRTFGFEPPLRSYERDLFRMFRRVHKAA